jgi:hypothetical protein|tara:strand:+ start:181 stop:336 length:156 start_codon:yes stop_codon:yes gene_type:complete
VAEAAGFTILETKFITTVVEVDQAEVAQEPLLETPDRMELLTPEAVEVGLT